MRAKRLHSIGLALLLTLSLLQCVTVGFAAEPPMSKEQMKEFLLKAKVVKSRQTSKGVTNPWRLTLSDGTITHDASFQAIDERKTTNQLANGTTEINFVDSYKYNVAGYLLAEMLGLDDMVPMYLERNWNGRTGSIGWWLPVKMDEGERQKQKLTSPNIDFWNKQIYKVRVFNELLYDTDANMTNILIGENWEVYRVDFSRAFRLHKTLQNSKNLVQCDRTLFEKLKALNLAELTQKTKGFLTKPEIDGVLARRDAIVAYFDKLIAEKGEKAVLY